MGVATVYRISKTHFPQQNSIQSNTKRFFDATTRAKQEAFASKCYCDCSRRDASSLCFYFRCLTSTHSVQRNWSSPIFRGLMLYRGLYRCHVFFLLHFSESQYTFCNLNINNTFRTKSLSNFRIDYFSHQLTASCNVLYSMFVYILFYKIMFL